MEVAVPAALAIAGAGTSYSQAASQNGAIERSMRSSNDATARQGQQLAGQAAIEKLKNARRAHATLAALRVAATDAGSADAGSFTALANQALIDSSVNNQIIGDNQSRAYDRILSDNYARQEQLKAQTRNPLLSALTGALSGASMGMGINSTFGLDKVASTTFSATSNAGQAAGANAMVATMGTPIPFPIVIP